MPSSGVSAPRVHTGALVSRYRVEECLGAGGMGTVYRAFDTILGRTVALKTFSSESTELLAGLRFLREAEVTAKLCHPNIVTIHDVGVQERAAFIILEHLAGHSLKTELSSARSPLGLDRTLATLLPVIDAVAYAHEQHVLHLDLKPSNLFLTHDHAGHQVTKVLDFGVCQLSEVEADLDPTRDEHSGTPEYMAPESLERAEASPQADQFALATVIYECIAGRSPFAKAGSVRELIRMKQSGTYPPLSSAVPGTQLALSDAVRRAMSPEKDARFKSLRDFGSALSAE